MDGTGLSLAVRSDMFEASYQRIPIDVGRDFVCGRWCFCVCEAIVESGRDAVDGVQQNRRVGWNVQWDVEVGGSGLEVDDDARFWWSGTNKWKERPRLSLA